MPTGEPMRAPRTSQRLAPTRWQATPLATRHSSLSARLRMWLVRRPEGLADQLIDVERGMGLLPRVVRLSPRLALLPLAALLTTAALLPASAPTAEAASDCAAFVTD